MLVQRKLSCLMQRISNVRKTRTETEAIGVPAMRLSNLVCCTCKVVSPGLSASISCPECGEDRLPMGGIADNTPIYPDASDEWWDKFVERLKRYHESGRYRRLIQRWGNNKHRGMPQ